MSDKTEIVFPKEINKYINGLNYSSDNIGRSQDKIYFFEDKYVLKISNNKERLLREKEKTDFLRKNNIPGSESVCFGSENNTFYYLRTYIKGDILCSKKFKDNPDILVNILVNVIEQLRKLDNISCPFFSQDNIGNDFVHGDLCLPNILVNKNNEFVGFVDLENSGLGDKWYDYAWLLWSLQYNLKTDRYNSILLEKCKLKFNEEKYNQYIPKEYR